MIGKPRRVAGSGLVVLLIVIFYMEAINHAKPSLLGNNLRYDRPLDLWTRFPEGGCGDRPTYHSFPTIQPASQPVNSIVTSDAVISLSTELDDDTSAVFALLSENQYPNKCHERKYFLWAPLNWGIGSDIHTIGA